MSTPLPPLDPLDVATAAEAEVINSAAMLREAVGRAFGWSRNVSRAAVDDPAVPDLLSKAEADLIIAQGIVRRMRVQILTLQRIRRPAATPAPPPEGSFRARQQET